MYINRENFSGNQTSKQNVFIFTCGALIGATCAYLADPQRGKARRAYLLNRSKGVSNRLTNSAGQYAKIAANIVKGTFYEAKAKLSNESVTDQKLVERVRSQIGRLVLRPKEIRITASNGIVCIKGPIIQSDMEDLVSGIRKVNGVKGIDNQLSVYSDASNMPELEGDSPPAHMSKALIGDADFN